MEYNIEKINEIGRLLEEIVEEAMEGEGEGEGEGEVLIGDIEMTMRESMLKIGDSALQCFLENADEKTEAEIECACGDKLKYQRRRKATIWSVFDKVVYKRAYYAGCACGKGSASVDQRYGIEPGKVTVGLAHLPWRAVPGKAEQSQRPKPDVVYGSIDAAKVRIEPRAEQEKAIENRETWRNLKAGCWYEGEVVPVRQQSVRQKDKAQREGVVLRARNKKYFCDIAEAKEFGKLLWATGYAVGVDRVHVLVFICNSAVWIWNLVVRYFPNAIQIVDWYHAADRLKRIAKEVFPNPGKRQAWLESITEDLWQGRVELVIEACQLLAKKSNLAKQSLLYYGNNMERMRYAQLRATGYLIGSGVIESGCKQIVTQRLKLPGAQWNLDGAILTAKARAAWMSGNWQKLVSARSFLPLAA